LVCLDIEGDWNKPLLVNAAALSNWDCCFAHSQPPDMIPGVLPDAPRTEYWEEALNGCTQVIAAETTRRSVNIFDFPAPRGPTAVLAGNEEKGIPRSVLKRVDRIISIPMAPGKLSSVNVAAAAATALYVLDHDLGRKPKPAAWLRQTEVDILIDSPTDPHELGSLFRSIYAFGWSRVFLSAPRGVWFTENSQTILESRAAARRAKNPLAVSKLEKLDVAQYDTVVVCDLTDQGSPLSKFRLPESQRLLIVYSGTVFAGNRAANLTHVRIDHSNREVEPRFRHSGTILFSLIARALRA
jgi:tRNA G18 (ribose-2'-O)-methylase SpoU